MALNEGQTVQYTVVTTRVADGTVLYWKTTGNTTNSDIVGGNTGSVTITNNQGVFNVTTSADVDTDGVKTLGISLSTGSQSGPTVVSTTNPIVVNDTSQAPAYRLYVFGSPAYGKSGLNDDSTWNSSPVQVGSDTTWSEIGVGQNQVLAIKTNGTLWGWGHNASGALGQNNVVYRSSPVQIGSLTNWSKIAAGTDFALAIKTDGTLWCWGQNYDGSLGLNNTVHRSSPVQVGSSSNWVNVASGSNSNHVLATDTNRYLYAWGNNGQGQLGTNDRNNKSSPVQVSQVPWWTGSLICAGSRTFATVVGGGGTQISMYSWGDNSLGQLGINNASSKSSPTQIGSLTDWSNVSAGESHALAVKSNGTLWAWGQNHYGQLGLNLVSSGTYVAIRSSPVQIGTDTNWSSVSVGYLTSFAKKTDGTVWSWGLNSSGTLGLGDSIGRSSPVQIGSNNNWNKVAAGWFMTALTTSS